MKAVMKCTMALLLAGFLSACSSGPSIKADYDPTVDFSGYKTFNFYNPMGIERFQLLQHTRADVPRCHHP